MDQPTQPIQISTSRFGDVTVDPKQMVTFPQGLIGFDFTGPARFALLPCEQSQSFYWLQSATDPEVAFLVVDPGLFFKDYQVQIREETQQDLELADAKDGQCLVICNRAGDWLTGNLLGPLVINTRTRVGQQVVLTEKKWTCRQPLCTLQQEQDAQLSRAAA
jgi:flagellar assembly factor FliW